MAGKLPNPRDKGRCTRCPHSVKKAYENKNGEERKHLECKKYGDWCQRVA